MTTAQREAVAIRMADVCGRMLAGKTIDFRHEAAEIIAAYEAARDAEDPRPPGPPEWGCGPDDRDPMGDWCSPVDMEAQ